MSKRWLPSWFQSLKYSQRIQLGILFVTIAYTFFAGGQWCAMNRNLDISERAKLVVRKVSTGDISVPFTVTVHIKNVGKLPAHSISIVKCGASIGARDQAPEFRYDPLVPGTELYGPIPPGDEWVWTYTPEVVVTALELPEISTRLANSWLYFYGEVQYDDGFGNTQLTPFCRRYLSRDRHSANRIFRRLDEYDREQCPPCEPTPIQSPTPQPGWIYGGTASCPFPYPP